VNIGLARGFAARGAPSYVEHPIVCCTAVMGRMAVRRETRLALRGEGVKGTQAFTGSTL